MQTTICWLNTVIGLLHARLAAARSDEAGYTLETVIVTAVLAGAAIVATGLIVNAIMSHAGAIK
jgi:hypothetical protein